MTIVQVDVLNGIDGTVGTILCKALHGVTNGDKLCICMYFMSDLSPAACTHERIAKNLPKLYLPGNDKDFEAGKIRGVFDGETQKVKSKKTRSEDRLWLNARRGCWQNTPMGNAQALRILQEQGIAVSKRGTIQQIRFFYRSRLIFLMDVVLTCLQKELMAGMIGCKHVLD